jgi:mannose/cellobiose epimerase-like protein (N-acyl-D-glucosamine 2-epimerase family)
MKDTESQQKEESDDLESISQMVLLKNTGRQQQQKISSREIYYVYSFCRETENGELLDGNSSMTRTVLNIKMCQECQFCFLVHALYTFFRRVNDDLEDKY